MRIGFYMHAPRIGGAETYLRDLAHGIDPREFEVHVFVPPWRGLIDFVNPHQASGIRIHVVRPVEPAAAFSGPTHSEAPAHFGTEAPASSLRRLAEALPLSPSLLELGHDILRYGTLPANRMRLARSLRSVPLDLLHVVNGGYPGAASAMAAILASRAYCGRCVMTVCGTPRTSAALHLVERRVDGEVARSCDAVVVPAAVVRSALVDRGFPDHRIKTISWGARAIEPRNDIVARRASRRALKIPDDARVLVCLANFTPNKGQTTVVRAVALLSKEMPDLYAVLGGAGPRLPAVTAEARRLGVADRIRLPGSFDEPWGLLGAADLFVLASETEGLPLVILEAMSQALPVVTTDVGGIAEAVLDGEGGFLVPPSDPEALAAAMRRALSDPQRAHRMGEAALRRFQTRFTMTAMLDRHQELYRHLVWRSGIPVTRDASVYGHRM